VPALLHPGRWRVECTQQVVRWLAACALPCTSTPLCKCKEL